jgi:hypothetical protein
VLLGSLIGWKMSGGHTLLQPGHKIEVIHVDEWTRKWHEMDGIWRSSCNLWRDHLKPKVGGGFLLH